MSESTGKTPGATKAYVDGQIASEASTRAAAVTAEVTARNSAISTAVAAEVTARDAAIAAGIAAVKQTRAGHVTIEVGDISLGVVAKRITFATPMPNSSYQVLPISNGLAGVFTTSAPDANGFTLNITSAVIGTVGYIAVQEQA